MTGLLALSVKGEPNYDFRYYWKTVMEDPERVSDRSGGLQAMVQAGRWW